MIAENSCLFLSITDPRNNTTRTVQTKYATAQKDSLRTLSIHFVN